MSPSQDALLHSEKLSALIRQEINASSGSISFSRFMELALYAPALGYYSAGSHKIGEKGDFLTAPEISPLFAKSIARQCQQIFADMHDGDFLELGAGSGRFAGDLLSELETLGHCPKHYYILEVSADLRLRQQHYLQTHCPTLFSRFVWLDQLPMNFRGIIFANEVMDALPVHCFRIEDEILERCVKWQDNAFHWHMKPALGELAEKITILQNEFSLPENYDSEIRLNLSAWINSLSETLKEGVILLLDYGYGEREYYHADRSQGTLMCYYQHQRHDNPFTYVGLQDMTAHVDFTTAAKSAVASGLSLSGYTTQASFLLSCGILEIAPSFSFEENNAIKKLTLPSQMGEAVKVMALSKHLPLDLKGFQLHDRKRDL